MLILVIVFIALFILSLKHGVVESSIKSLLQFSFLIVVITEILSLFKAINVVAVFSSWIGVLLLLSYVCFQNKIKTKKLLSLELHKLKVFYTKSNKFEKCLIIVSFLIIILLFLQGVFYPPNNWDSLTYHMSRIMYWIGNGSVSHFPTHILRHLYQPPFAEYMIMNINLLNGNDYFSNAVQLVFLLGSSFVIWKILTLFAVNKQTKLISVLFLLTIPAVLLQATTTKNDIVSGFFILCSILYFFKIYFNAYLRDFIYLGITVGLAFLTKGTSYLFIAPIILVFGVLILKKIIVDKNIGLLKNSGISIVLILLINIGHYSRNYQLDQNILNIDKQEAKNYSNENISLKTSFSNLSKNLALHISFPLNEPADEFIRKLHSYLEIDINDPRNNYLGITYSKAYDFSTHEDFVSNFIHLILIFISFSLLFLKKKSNSKASLLTTIFGLIIIIQFLLFVTYLKWQPWHTRLHIPIFMEASVLVACGFSLIKNNRKLVFIVSLLLLLNAFVFIFYNNLRPIIKQEPLTKNISLTDNRFKKYFVNQPQLYKDYRNIVVHLNTEETVGLILSDWEYPLFFNYYYSYIKPIAINVNNVTSKLYTNQELVNCIISNTKNNEFIDYNGTRYYNISAKNSYIWLYTKNK